MIRAALLSAGHAKMLRGPISASGQSWRKIIDHIL